MYLGGVGGAAALHNTPAVCRSSYVHPDVLDLALEDSPAGIDAIARPPAARLRGLRADENRLLAYLSAAGSKKARP